MREASASKPSVNCRKRIRRCQNRGVTLPPTATDFRAGRVEVITDNDFAAGKGFTEQFAPDPKLPDGYPPFNIKLIGNKFFVTFAVQDDAKHDDVAGQSRGIVDNFDLSGEFLQRFPQHAESGLPGWRAAVVQPGGGWGP